VPKTITAGTGDSYPSQMARGVLLEDYPESPPELTACIPSAASDTHRVPLPLSETLLRTGLAGPRVSATESIQTQLIEDYRPIAKSLPVQERLRSVAVNLPFASRLRSCSSRCRRVWRPAKPVRLIGMGVIL